VTDPTRAEMERETREGLAVAGPMSFAEAFYLARRAEGLGCMEATLATRMRDRWLPRAVHVEGAASARLKG